VRVMLRLAVLASFALAAAAPRAIAQDVGFLLGVADRSTPYDSTPERLSTWWITYREGKAFPAKTVAGLVVPRESGFWRFGISRFCTLPTAENGLTEHHCADSIWTRVAAQAAPRARVTAPGDACPVDALSIHFASPAFLSISRNYWRSECRGSFLDGQESFVHTYESADSVSFATLGAGARAAYRGAAAQALNVGAADSLQVQQDESCHTEPDEDTGWLIRRRQNRWSGVLFQQHGSDLCVFQQPIDWALPARALGYAETAIDWNGVTRLEPDAEQVVPVLEAY